MAYQSVAGAAQAERVIEKSRFLSFSQHVESEDEARAFLKKLHEEHPLATHICYAYVADKVGNLIRFSDDGEPQGTAGMPILGVIRAQKLYETAVAVVRYFGGIKLGAGGLTRAYAASAQDVLNEAHRAEYDVCVKIKLSVSYSDTDALNRFLSSGYNVENREFGEGACFTVSVRESEEEAFIGAVKNLLGGRVKFQTGTRQYAPVT